MLTYLKAIQFLVPARAQIDDFKKVYVKLERHMKRVAVIGGGFLGTELAYGIASMHEGHNKQATEDERRRKEALKQRTEYEARMRELGHDLSARPLPFFDEGQTALRASPYLTLDPRRVVQIFPEAHPLGHVLPPALSDEIQQTLEQSAPLMHARDSDSSGSWGTTCPL